MTARLRMALAAAGAAIVAFGAFTAGGPLAEADAAILPAEYAKDIVSAQLDGPAIYWLKLNPNGYYGGGRDGGIILRRDLALNGETKVVFSSPRRFAITGFRAAYGRIAIAQTNSDSGESRVLELKQQGEAWLPKTLMIRSTGPSGEACGAKARLITINPAAEIVTEDFRFAGRGGECTIQRPLSTLAAIAADGTTRTLLERKGAWGTSKDMGALGYLTHGAGDWLISRESGGMIGGRTGLLNIAGGEFSPLTDAPSSFPRPEISTQGQLLVNIHHSGGTAAKLFPNPLDPSSQTMLTRRNRTSWFHLCGEKMLEISRRSTPGESGPRRPTPGPPTSPGSGRRPSLTGGSRWYLWIANMQGQRERRLPQKLRRGTAFEACDAGQAVFHRYLRKGRARQFSVSLG